MMSLSIQNINGSLLLVIIVFMFGMSVRKIEMKLLWKIKSMMMKNQENINLPVSVGVLMVLFYMLGALMDLSEHIKSISKVVDKLNDY